MTNRNRALALLLVIVLFSAIGGIVAWSLARRAVRETVQQIATPVEKTVDISALVTQVRELSRLETASMRVIHVSTITQSYKMVPNAVAGDELTFLAAGDVIAGIDLSHIQQHHVRRESDGTIVMRLPPPQILVTRVDNRESRVLTRKTGMLRRADINLESRARQNAEQSIRNEAVRKGILKLASQNGERKLADFLNALGFQRVRFESSALATPTL